MLKADRTEVHIDGSVVQLSSELTMLVYSLLTGEHKEKFALALITAVSAAQSGKPLDEYLDDMVDDITAKMTHKDRGDLS